MNEMIGNKYGRLVVVGKADPHIYPSGQKSTMWKCVCECGNETIVQGSSLRRGFTKSCGCYRHDVLKKPRTHGLTGNPLLGVWSDMLRRCYDENKPQYKDWGGRGIIVCDEWKNDVSRFVEWAGKNGYKKGLCIDRINNDGNYQPENCRFVTHAVNNFNRRPKYKNNTHGLVGIIKEKNGKWSAEVTYRRKRYLKYGFANKIDAALARDSIVIGMGAPHPLNFNQSNGVMDYVL